MKTNHGSLLVVDDDKHILEAMADYLRSLGHRTETASSCKDAMDRMAEFPFEVVLCDVNLGDLDGFQLLEWATEHCPDASVILITGYATDIDDPTLRTRGIDAVLPKPCRGDDLRAVLARVNSVASPL